MIPPRSARAAALLLTVVALTRSAVAPVRQAPWPTPPVEQDEGAVATVARDQAYLLGRLRADRWHAAGLRGRDIKVAVIDSGFRGYRAHLGRALPQWVEAKSFRADGDLEAKDSQHGILCAEVVHAIAPEAKLLFANWEPEESASFVDAVRWARERGARIITCSVIMPCWSDGEGGGPVHRAMEPIIGDGRHPNDLLCFACAGNTAQRHWAGRFRDSGDGQHLWRADLRDNIVTAWGDELLSIELCWPAGASYALTVTDLATGREAARSAPEGQCAVARFVCRPKGRYGVRVRHLGGEPGTIHLAVLGGWLEQFTERGSISFPADGPAWLAIGAWEDNRRAVYSSCGPNSPVLKPDFVAPVPFTSAWRSKPFGGTSAAAPQGAALAALVWSKHPDWTAEQVRSSLRAAAQDLLTPGHDWETGYGLLRLPSEN